MVQNLAPLTFSSLISRKLGSIFWEFLSQLTKRVSETRPEKCFRVPGTKIPENPPLVLGNIYKQDERIEECKKRAHSLMF